MDIKLGNQYPAGALSNLAPHKFVFRGFNCGSMEGLCQGLKFKDPNMQVHVFTLSGHAARGAGQGKNWQKTQTLWWQGEAVKRDSDTYQELFDEAYACLFDQNAKARKALLATKSATLQHSIGRRKISEPVLTVREFCSRLTKNRDRIQAEEFLEF